MSAPIEREIWRPDPNRSGYLELERTRTVGEVHADIRRAFGEYPEGAEEYLTVCAGAGPGAEDPWPRGRIAVYVVTGSSEGHYVHVDVIDDHGGRRPVLLAKTFAGWRAAWYFAEQLAERLEV